MSGVYKKQCSNEVAWVHEIQSLKKESARDLENSTKTVIIKGGTTESPTGCAIKDLHPNPTVPHQSAENDNALVKKEMVLCCLNAEVKTVVSDVYERNKTYKSPFKGTQNVSDNYKAIPMYRPFLKSDKCINKFDTEFRENLYVKSERKSKVQYVTDDTGMEVVMSPRYIESFHYEYKCSDKNDLKRHTDTVNQDFKNQHRPHSRYSSSCSVYVKQHIQSNLGCENYLGFPLGQYQAAQLNALNRDIEGSNKDSKKFSCPDCLFKTYQKGHLKDHIKAVHQGLKKYSCPHCEYKTCNKSHLKEHIEAVHQGVRKYSCVKCPYKSNQKQVLKRHIEAIHQRLKKYSCPHCQLKYNQKSNLKQHIEAVHQCMKKYSCPYCQYTSNQKGNLKQHIESVHQGKKKYSCPHCQYKSNQKGNLKQHIESIHQGLKEYSCPHCQYKSKWKGNLKQHIESLHQGLKKYSCPQCQYKSSWKNNLKRHTLNVHQ